MQPTTLTEPRITTDMKTVFIFERGIMGWESVFGNWKNWPNQAIVWMFKRDRTPSQTLTYFTGPILAGVTRHWRAKQFAKLIKQYEGWRIVLVAHSEGTATGLLAWKLAGYPLIDEVHLIAGACNSDCDRNGINHAVKHARINKLYSYVAGRDMAMRLEDTYVGSLCFGLQCGGTPMGLDGPKNMTPETSRVMTVKRWPRYGHSDCFLPHNFDSTMLEIIHENKTTHLGGLRPAVH